MAYEYVDAVGAIRCDECGSRIVFKPHCSRQSAIRIAEDAGWNTGKSCLEYNEIQQWCPECLEEAKKC